MQIPRPITIDYETFGIEARPKYPPRPVGVSIKYPGKKAKYWAWGHPTKNNCTQAQATAELDKVISSGAPLLCQNGKFDWDVGNVHLGLPIPHWSRCHDTQFLLFLHDPHASSFALKPAAHRLLDMPPDERDAVKDWIYTNGIITKQSKEWGAHIAKVPGDIVGRYADGDTLRTEKLFELLYPEIVERGMSEAYDRERQLMPCLLKMESRGIPVDHDRLRIDCQKAEALIIRIDGWLRMKLKSDSVNLDSDEQLLELLIKRKLINQEKLLVTAKGNPSSSADSLKQALKDPSLFQLFKYRGQLLTYNGTFMQNWLRVADETDGLIHTQWNQTRDGDEKKLFGAQTGRLSSTPNFQNAPSREFDYVTGAAALTKLLGWALPPLPVVRSYVIPFEGDVFVDRDYSQQEPRILGHFEDGALLAQYLADPWTDVHDFAREKIIEKTHRQWDRRPVKDTNLGLIYGMGIAKLAAKTGLSFEDAKLLKTIIMKQIYPGIGDMYKDMKERSKAGVPIRTWGGREYYCEEPKIVNGQIREFDYKQLNKLIQGSAADCTKQAVINYFDMAPECDKLLLTVHDQLLSSVPAGRRDEAMEILQVSMEMVPFDVEMLSEGEWSATNWWDMDTYDKRGKRVATEIHLCNG